MKLMDLKSRKPYVIGLSEKGTLVRTKLLSPIRRAKKGVYITDDYKFTVCRNRVFEANPRHNFTVYYFGFASLKDYYFTKSENPLTLPIKLPRQLRQFKTLREAVEVIESLVQEQQSFTGIEV